MSKSSQAEAEMSTVVHKLREEIPSYDRDVRAFDAALEQLRKLTRSDKIRVLLDELERACQEIQEQAETLYDDRLLAETSSEELTEDVYALHEALDDCLGDRAAMLGRLKMSDFQWSAQGGMCEADFDPPLKVIS